MKLRNKPCQRSVSAKYVRDVRLDAQKHLRSGLGDLDENTVVDLEQTEELQDLAGLGGDVVDTLDAHDKVDLGLGGDVEVAAGLGLTLQANLLTLGLLVLVDVLLGALEDDLTLGLAGLASLEGSRTALLSGLGGSLPLLFNVAVYECKAGEQSQDETDE